MRKFTALLLAALPLAACAGDQEGITASGGPLKSPTATRVVFVDATTRFVGAHSGSLSGGYVKGWATPVGGGSGYLMGDVEADGNSGANFTENTGYTGQLDAFKYNSQCTYKWLSGATQISTASTIYLADYPNATSITLSLTCPGEP